MATLEVYERIFKAMSGIYIIPYKIDKKELKVKSIEDKRSKFLYNANVYFSIFTAIKQGVILSCNISSKEDWNLVQTDLVLQFLWLFGCIMFCAISHNQLLYGKQISNLFTMWIRLERDLSVLMKSRAEKEMKNWMKLRLIQTRFGTFAWGAAFLIITPLFYWQPRFPPFLYSLVPTELDTPENYWILLILWITLAIPDIYLLPCAWGNMFALDLQIGTISTHLALYLDALCKPGISPGTMVKVCKSFHLIMLHMNNAFANGLVIHMALASFTILLLVYGIINNSGSAAVLIFCLANCLAMLGRIVHLLIPLAGLQVSSKRLKEFIKFILPLTITLAKVERREMTSIRQLRMSSGGIYSIDYDCVFHYINYLISYTVVIIKI